MSTRLYSVVVDAADHSALARFWAGATGWPITLEEPYEVVVEPPDGEPGVPLVFLRVGEPKVVKNRVHIDLNSRDAEHQAAQVEALRRAGATPVDIGQGAVPWVVLADPEGNEFCVLDHRAVYAGAGPIAAVVLDSPDPFALAPFWVAASGWEEVARDDNSVSLANPAGPGPRLEILRVADPKVAKNRIHIDVAPWAGDDQAADVARLTALGAAPVDIGQGQQTWVVLADPDGNEVCVLTSRKE
jgi:predicted enzyme related to lactoylglutathione lyase